MCACIRRCWIMFRKLKNVFGYRRNGTLAPLWRRKCDIFMCVFFLRFAAVRPPRNTTTMSHVHFSTPKVGGILLKCPRRGKWRRGAVASWPNTVRTATPCTFDVEGSAMASARSRGCMTTAIAPQGQHRARGGWQHRRCAEN